MPVKKRTAFKSLFVITFVLAMLGITKWVADGFNLPYHESATWVLSGAIWAYIASTLFDRFSLKMQDKKKHDDTREQLQIVLKELGETKNIINK